MTIAFPSAEGYGAATQGARARGGSIKVYKVTNLNDSGSGSLRAGAEASGPRIIVFSIGGTIVCKSSIVIKSPYCTILGQTAPGGGICLTRPGNESHRPLEIEASEVILRYIRIRAGEHKAAGASSGGDCLKIGTKDRTVKNVIVDHVTCTWATDETIDVYQPCENITIQWSLLGDAIQAGSHDKDRLHGFGPIFGPGCKSFSYHHNLNPNVRSRAPRIKTEYTTPYEVIANVQFNCIWDDGQWSATHIRSEYGVDTQRVNIINSTAKIGKDRETTKGYMVSAGIKDGGKPEVYLEGNRVLETNGADVTNSNGRDVIKPSDAKYVVNKRHEPLHNYPITTSDAETEFDAVLDGAGCTIPIRDSLDKERVKGVRDGTGRWILEDQAEVGGLPYLPKGTPWDSGSDGLPQDFVNENGGDISGAQLAPSGYTWLEEWSFTLTGDTSSGGGGDENMPPQVDVGPDLSVTLPAQALLKSTVTDDGLPGPLSYQWTQDSGPGDAIFESPKAKETAVTFPVDGTYRLRLTASDGELEDSDKLNVTVRKENTEEPNQPPKVDVGPDINVTLPAQALLKSTVTDDGLPAPLSFQWTQDSGPGDAIFESPNAKETAVTFPVDGTYRLRLTASDGELEDSDKLNVTVLKENTEELNQPPKVDVGPDISVTLPAQAFLTPTVNDDGIPGPLSYQWTQDRGPGDVIFESPNAKETAVTFPEDGSYRLRLTASDGDLEDSDRLYATVHKEISEEINQPPDVDAGLDVSVTLPAQAFLKATATDDGLPGPLSFQWTQDSGPGDAIFESPNAKETAVTFPVDGSYRLRFTASDGELENSDKIDVTVRADITPPPSGDLTFVVSQASDDVTFSTDEPALEVDGRRIYAGHYDVSLENNRALMRFQNVNVANDAEVAAASLSLFVTGVNGRSPALRIYALDENDSAELTDETNVASRLTSLTTSYVSWTADAELDDEWTTTPDISAILNEVIARPGWVSGNALTLVLAPVSTEYSVQERLRISAYEDDPQFAARLEISGVSETPRIWQSGTIRIGTRIGAFV